MYTCHVKGICLMSALQSYFNWSQKIANQAKRYVNLFWSGTSKNIYSAEDHSSVHLFMPQMQQGIQIAIKTRALERCREMDLHPNSLRVLALTLLRIGSESISWKPSLLNSVRAIQWIVQTVDKCSAETQLRLNLSYLWSTTELKPIWTHTDTEIIK